VESKYCWIKEFLLNYKNISKIETDANFLSHFSKTTVQKLTTSTSVKLNALRRNHDELRRGDLEAKRKCDKGRPQKSLSS
jgi:hypothetical protein